MAPYFQGHNYSFGSYFKLYYLYVIKKGTFPSKTTGKKDHILTKEGLGNHLVTKKSCIFMFHRFLFVNSTSTPSISSAYIDLHASGLILIMSFASVSMNTFSSA